MFFNTNKSKGKELDRSIKNSFKQEDIILGLFVKDENLSREDVEKKCRIFGYNYPTASVVRAMSVLTSQGKLQKTDVMKMGSYGVKVHTWRLMNDWTER